MKSNPNSIGTKKSNYLKDRRKSNMSNMNDAYILQFHFAFHIERRV